MTRHTLRQALFLSLSAAAFILTGCATTESRIADHPEIFQNLSQRDQELVHNGQIRVGMSTQAVWLAWGSPDQKTEGAMRNRATETWIYNTYTTYPYAYYGGPYGPYPYYGGFGYGGAIRFHHHHSFVFWGDPFYDPFYYSYIPPTVSYPYKIVTFSNGRVASYQVLKQ